MRGRLELIKSLSNVCFGIGRKREKKFEKLQFLQLVQRSQDPSSDPKIPDRSDRGSIDPSSDLFQPR